MFQEQKDAPLSSVTVSPQGGDQCPPNTTSQSNYQLLNTCTHQSAYQARLTHLVFTTPGKEILLSHFTAEAQKGYI